MRRLTTTDVARRPYPGTTAPTSIHFSPDGSVVTYLVAEPGSLRQQLVAVDAATGEARVVPTPGSEVDEASLTIEEQLRRERARELAVGVTRYSWAGAADRVLIPMADGLWLLDGVDGSPRLLVPADAVPGPILDAQISDDGTVVGFVSDDEVYVVDADGGLPRPVTSGARGTGTTHGLAEYIAQEEMGRPYGFWLSPDGSRVAFCAVDDTHIPVYRIVHQGSDRTGGDAQEDHRYPFAGAANATVRLGITSTETIGAGPTHDVEWLDLSSTGIGSDRYLARVDWVGNDAVLAQVEDRSQSRLDLVRFDLAGAATWLLSETSDIWINLHDLLRIRADGSFLWASERSGFRHLEVRNPDGGLRNVLTAGSWLVTDVAAMTDDAVFFTATQTSPLERQLHRVPLDAVEERKPDRVTEGRGVHASVVHGPTGRVVDVHSTPDAPPVTTLLDPDGSTVAVLHDAGSDPAVDEVGLVPPELRTVTADDGTELHAAVFRPAGDGPHPTVIWVYGGPHAQLVTASWALTVQMRAQFLAQEGFCVAVVDNRGSANRGLAFEGALRHRMGTVEVDDQVRLVHDLVADGLADPDRVGIYGWSYGGYMTALCLARRPDVFRAACAGAPVTSWDGYDTHYTERYMSTPTENPDGYRAAAVMTHVEGVRDRHLLLVHGLIDENVHFRHTARLLNALIAADIDHRLLLYPDERHVPRGEADRVSMEGQILSFFARHLGGPRSASGAGDHLG